MSYPRLGTSKKVPQNNDILENLSNYPPRKIIFAAILYNAHTQELHKDVFTH